jgi:tRNA dimethylallyltransferase
MTASDARVIAIVGPTAVGKSALAEEVAVRLRSEIVSADSMQVYRGMDIGTAKVPAAERRVPYHCVDLIQPGEPFSAALYQEAARHAIASIAARGLTPVVAGGTGLYVRSALDDWSFPAGEQTDNDVRTRYERMAEEQGADAVHRLLADRDPASAELIHPHNVRRVVRALEMHDLGTSYAEQSAGFSKREPYHETTYVGLGMSREKLYERIDRRVDGMVELGLVDEVRGLLERGFHDALTAQQAIGYKELVPVIEGGADLRAAIDAIKQATRRYAKRQLTWFRADPRILWLEADGASTSALCDAVLKAVRADRI